MERAELQESVQRTVLAMPDHLREILLLSYFHQFPYKQISDILEIPLGTVKSRLHAAVAHFADRWQSEPKEAGVVGNCWTGSGPSGRISACVSATDAYPLVERQRVDGFARTGRTLALSLQQHQVMWSDLTNSGKQNFQFGGVRAADSTSGVIMAKRFGIGDGQAVDLVLDRGASNEPGQAAYISSSGDGFEKRSEKR